MSDNGATSIPPQTFVECGLCYGDENISWFCKNCSFSLCDACATAHPTRKQYKPHSVVPRTYTVLRLYGPAKLAEQCHLHPEKEIASYCNECNVPCCVTCMVKDHKRHDFSTIEDTFLDAEISLNEYYRRLDTEVRPQLDEFKKQAKTDVSYVEMNVEKVVNDINDFRENLFQHFDWVCDDLIVQVKNYSSKSNDWLEEIENSLEKLESIKEEVEETLASGNLNIIEYKPPDIESFVPKLNRPTKIVPIFEPNKKVLCAMKETVGIIQLKKQKKNEIDNRTIMRSINIRKMHVFKSEIYASSLTTAGINRVWVMYYGNDTMYLYNDIGEVVRYVTIDGCIGIIDMAITKTGEMIVACLDQKVRCVSVDGNLSILINTAPFTCEGVCLTDKEEIVACMNGQGSKNHVAVYSPDGRRKICKVRYMDGQGNLIITNPFSVVQNDEDLCVVNAGINVVCVDERNDVRWVYNDRQAKLDNPFSPRCICRDRHTNLLVTDVDNDCVHYIDREGGLIQVILTKGQTSFINHYGICVDDETEHVWVANRMDRQVIVAKYLD